MKLDKKVALVTGAGRGIGKAIAIMLAKEGADIIVNDMDSDSAARTAEEILSIGRKSLVSVTNVAVRTEVESMFEAIKKEFGRLDIMVCKGLSKFRRDLLVVQIRLEACVNTQKNNLVKRGQVRNASDVDRHAVVSQVHESAANTPAATVSAHIFGVSLNP